MLPTRGFLAAQASGVLRPAKATARRHAQPRGNLKRGAPAVSEQARRGRIMSARVAAKNTCLSCGVVYTPTRPWQSCCTKTCAGRLRQERRRQAQKRRDTTSPVSQQAKWRDTAPSKPPAAPRPIVADNPPPVRYGWDPSDLPLTPSPLDGKLVLSGDDYPIEMDADGYPIMPMCLDRRRKTT